MAQENITKTERGTSGISSFVKTITRSIKSSLNRYLSIILIVGIGGGFFAGVRATAPSMRLTAQEYFNEYSLMDLKVLSTVGFSEDDVTEVEKIEHVKQAMVGYSVDLIMENGENTMAAKVYALQGGQDYAKGLNNFEILEGRYPEDYNECIIAEKDSNNHYYNIGDVVTFAEYAGETEVDTIMGCREYTVVGIVKSPMYFSYDFGSSSVGSGTTGVFLMIPPVNFLYSRFTEPYIGFDCADLGIDPFSEEYEEIVEGVTKQLSKIGEVQYAEFVEESKQQIDDAQNQLNTEVEKANKELGNAQSQLNDAKSQIDSAMAELTNGWSDYYSSKEKVEKELLEAYNKIVDGEKEIKKNEELLKSAKRDYEVAKEKYDRETSEAREKLDKGWAEYTENLRLYNEKYAEYTEGLDTYNSAASVMTTVNGYISGLYALIDADDPLNLVSYVRTASVDLKSMRDYYARQLSTMMPGTTEYQAMKIALDTVDSLIATMENILQVYDSSQGGALKEYFRNASRELVNAIFKSARENNQKLEDSKAQLTSAKSQLESAKAELDAAKKTLDEGEAELAKQSESGKAQLDSAKAQLDSSEIELSNAKKTLEEGKKSYSEGKAKAEKELSSALDKLNDAETQLDAAKSEYDQGLWIYNQKAAEANAQINDAQSRITGAKLQLEEIVEGKWYVFTRGDVIQNYSNLIDDSSRIDKMMTIFPMFFLLVAALVCLTTMSRMVDEERGQLGTFKSLGYSNAQIVSKYIIYAGSAAIIGIIIGEILCTAVLPKAIFGAYKLMYDIPHFKVSIPWIYCLFAFAVGIACTVLVAVYCCNKELKSSASVLMRQKAPSAGKQILLEKIPTIWNRMGFFRKVTARNLFRYKARLIMTTIGIGGCMTLLVSGFGMQDSVNPLVEMQFQKISDFDYSFVVQKTYTREEALTLADEMRQDSRVEALGFGSGEYGTALSGSKKVKNVQLTVFQQPEELLKIYDLHDFKTKEKYEVGDGEIILSEKLATSLGVSKGDTVTFKRSDDTEYEMKVTGICEYYVYHYIFMNANTFENIFKTDAKFNCIFMKKTDSVSSDELLNYAADVLEKYPNIIQATNVERAASIFQDCIDGLSKVVYIMIASAGMLAFVVLYNLTNINISERFREIATIKVLGFKNNETNSYVFRENIIMSFLGMIVGCFTGYLLAKYIVVSTEVENVMFYRHVEPMSYVYSALLTILFTLIVNWIMSFKIKKIQMVESLKAVE